MFIFFIKITLLTYFLIFIVKSILFHLFNNFLFDKLSDIIRYNYKSIIKQNPYNEWILAKFNGYKERSKEDENRTNDEYYRYIIEQNENKNKSFINDNDINNSSNIFRKIINAVWEENTTSFSIMVRSTISLLYIKIMYQQSHLNELFFGLFLGITLQLADFIIHMFRYMKRWYFGDRNGLDIGTIIIRKNKLSSKFIYIAPFITIFLLNILKANIYTRIFGEWLMDLSYIYIYISQIMGYLLIQNCLRIIDYTRHSASILFLMLINIIILTII